MYRSEKITNTQLFLWMLTYTFGDMSILNSSLGTGAGHDSWVSFVIAMAIGFILAMMYGEIMKLNPSKTIIEIGIDHFGKVIGIVLGICYVIYFTYAGSLVYREFGEYIHMVNYEKTPIYILMWVLSALTAYAVRSGGIVIGKIFEMLSFIFILFVIFVSLLLIPRLDFSNLMPFFEADWKLIFKGTISSVAFPFGELVVFMMIFAMARGEDVKRIAISASMLGGCIILFALLRDIMVLGSNLIDNVTFPAQYSSELIPDPLNIAPLISVNLMIGSTVEATTYLYASTLGISQCFELKEYKPFVLQMAIFISILSVWNYKNIQQFFLSVSEGYIYFAIPFQIIIPLIILIISKIKKNNTTS